MLALCQELQQERAVSLEGTEFDAKAGDITRLPSGHDAWVVGDEPVVAIDWRGALRYAEKA